MMPIKTHEFTIEAVYDDTLTDYFFSRGTIVIEGLVSANGSTIGNGPFMNYTLASGPAGGATPVARTNISVPGNPIAPGAPGFIPAAGGSVGTIGAAGLGIAGLLTPLGTVTRTFPTPPVTTHTAIRHRLETPRQQLYLYSGLGMAEAGIPAGSLASPTTWGATVLAAAPASMVLLCDPHNGPKPHLFSIKEALGDTNLFVVVWGCEFFFNEAFQNNLSPIGALLSNRFSQTHHVDKDGWTTIVTEGTATFRTDVLYGSPAAPFVMPAPTNGLGIGTPVSPDAFRASLFLPVLLGFTREIDYVTGMEDVTGVKYQYTDTQTPVNFVAGPYVNPALPGTGASSISVLHRQAIVSNNQDILGSALNAYERYAGLQANRNIAKESESKQRNRKKKRKPVTPPREA